MVMADRLCLQYVEGLLVGVAWGGDYGQNGARERLGDRDLDH